MEREGQPNTFWKEVARRRRYRGLSRSEVARGSGVNRTFLFRAEELGRPTPSRDVVLAIASSLRLDDDDVNEFLLTAGLAPTVDGLIRLRDNTPGGPADAWDRLIEIVSRISTDSVDVE